MAYSGTLVVSGRAKGIVVATGGDTELGHINQMLSGVKAMETPLLRQIEKFGKILTIIILIVCAITFAYGRLFLDIGFVDMFKALSAWLSQPFRRAFPPSLRLPWPSESSEWPGATRSSVDFPPLKPSDRYRESVPIRPVRSPEMKWWSVIVATAERLFK